MKGDSKRSSLAFWLASFFFRHPRGDVGEEYGAPLPLVWGGRGFSILRRKRFF